MRAITILRKFGWRLSKGKWIAEGHSKPLSEKQAKNALARDLKTKDFDALKKSPRLQTANTALDAGYSFHKGKFKKSERSKPRSLDEVTNELAKSKLTEKGKAARGLGFRDDSERARISAWTKANLELYKRFVSQYHTTQGASTVEIRALIARLLYLWQNGRTKAIRQKALNDLLLLVGYRAGNEPWPAGQTPPKR